jgi:16S rRNA processing protein RimM
MKLDSCYKIGLITRPHGLKGEVTVFLDDPGVDWDSTKSVFIRTGNSLVPYFIEQLSVQGTKAYIKFEDVTTPESAAQIAKHEIFLPKTARPKSGRGEFYDDEIIGFTVTDATAGAIGTVTDVVTSGPARLLEVKNDKKEILIPIDGPFITSINKSKKKIEVDLPDGFLDI